MSTADVRGRFIWHELLTTDTAGAAAFYPRVVPWRTQPSSMPGYTLWMAGQTQIGGLTALPQEVGGPPSHWLIYVGTSSVDASCAQAQGLGARVLKAPADIPNVGRFAVLSDPQGGAFAVQEAPRPATQPRPPPVVSAAPKPATAPKPALAPRPTAALVKAAPAAPQPAAVRKPVKKAAKKKAVKKARKKVARKPRAAKRKTGGRKIARQSARTRARRAAPKKRARGRRR